MEKEFARLLEQMNDEDKRDLLELMRTIMNADVDHGLQFLQGSYPFRVA